MITVGIIGVLAAVAIPAFLRMFERAKDAEAPLMLKELAQGEIGYFLRPRYAADGTTLLPCWLLGVPNPAAFESPGVPRGSWRSARWYDGSESDYYFYNVL